MTTLPIEYAARNNAIWCNAVCQAHGIPGEFYEDMWLNRHAVPRFYPNMITLTGQKDVPAQISRIQSFIDSNFSGGWGIKDSFSALPLGELGFQMLFQATWLWRGPCPTKTFVPKSGFQWSTITTTSRLDEWEMAWGRDQGDDPQFPQPRLFLPTLLDDPDIVFIAGDRNGEIVAGAIGNRTGDVVGVSNIFTPDQENKMAWLECIQSIQNYFPGLSLVGYEHGDQLAIAEEAGFEKVGELKVWIRQA